MRTPSMRGSPTTVRARRACSAVTTSASRSRGTSALRIAVHFCPAFTVISRATSAMNSSNSGVPASASAPRMDELSESVSATKRTEFATTAGCVRSRAAVAAEPVNETTSWQPRWSNRSPTPPQISCSAPAGSSPVSRMRRTTRSVR